MRGLGELLHRSTTYVATNDVTGATETFVVVDGIAPSWPTSSYRGVVAVPGAWRASMLIADMLGGFPWLAYRERGDRPLERLTPTPPLLDQPSPPDTRMTTFSSLALDLIYHGNAIALIAATNAEGWPTALVPVSADMVGVRRVTSGMDSLLPIGAIEYQIGGRSFSPYDVLHIKGPCSPGALRGMGVLEAHIDTFNLAAEQNRQARSISQHGVPTGLLKQNSPDATEDQAKVAKAGWLKAQRDRTIAVLSPGVDFTPLSWNPEELELVEARKFQLHEIALIFGLDPTVLGVPGDSETYQNVETKATDLLKFSSIAGHVSRFEQALTTLFPRGTYVKANLDAVLRADTKTRYEAHEIALRNKFLDVDEVRALEERPPMRKPLELPPAPDPEEQQEPTDDE